MELMVEIWFSKTSTRIFGVCDCMVYDIVYSFRKRPNICRKCCEFNVAMTVEGTSPRRCLL
jgi:hypothetical protein